MSLRIPNEVARLVSVVVHRPGPELDRMVPENIERTRKGPDGRVRANPDYLLFDDLVDSADLRSEHDALVAVCRAATEVEGGTVHALRDLIERTLSNDKGRQALVEAVSQAERRAFGWTPNKDLLRLLDRMDPHRLARTLLEGTDPETDRRVFRWPAPNALFARDLCAVVRDRVVVAYPRWSARAREFAAMREVVRWHPLFAGREVVDIARAYGGVLPPGVTLEGGDVVVLSEEAVAIGTGIRTSVVGALALARELFSAGVRLVYLVSLPQRRGAMHLDTLFTLIASNECLAYEPAVASSATGEAVQVHRLEASESTDALPAPSGKALLDVLRADGFDLDVVPCGGGDALHARREQWSDGANAFALAPGKIVVYGRNRWTLRALNAAGYEVVSADAFCRNAALLLRRAAPKVAVTIGGSELSRGRGGPRCLTCPLVRAG